MPTMPTMTTMPTIPTITTNYILIDTSYWIFYRYFAIVQWWKHANPDSPLGDNPSLCEEFVEKFKKTMLDTIATFKKNHKLTKQPCIIIACRDCYRCDIWRNALYGEYKGTRVKDDAHMYGEFFKMVYADDNKMLKDAGVDHVFQFPTLEADDLIAITKEYLRAKYGIAKIWIIASDHDYLQLLDDNTSLITLQNKNLLDSKKVFPEAAKNLFFKIVLGDKSDNILPIFKTIKCGPKTAEKFYEDRVMFDEALKKDNDSYERYNLNKKLVAFSEIPIELKSGFLEANKAILEGL